MLARVAFLALTGFWLVMNVLLWRAEYGAGPALGSTVPPQLVWDKILTAPDSSSLTIFRRGKKIGFCHWTTSVGEDLARLSSTEAAPEGMVRKIRGYRLELSGNVMLSEPSDRLRFDSHLSLGADRDWKEFAVRLNWHTDSWEVRSLAAQQSVHFRWQQEQEKFERVFSFAELAHPENLIQEFAGPVAAGALSGLGLGQAPARAGLSNGGMDWAARFEHVKLGHASVRVYRLELKVLAHFTAVVFVSRVGEILRMELPDGIVLTNDQLGGH